ncbi:MAG TPA: PDZ domain-containing protein [Gemmatimonadales bacterium]
MTRNPVVCLGLLLATSTAAAQHPLRHPVDAVELRFDRAQPILNYILRVDPADLSGFAVELRVRNAPDSFLLAMAAHPEYDDQYWRFLNGPTVEGAGGAHIVRVDSALWRVTAPGGEATLHYRLQLPPQSEPRRSAWRPFLAPTGGLLGGPHSFLYLVGATLAPSHLTLELPAGWEAASGLEPTSDPRTYFSPSTAVLVDAPILVGRFRTWRWAIDGVPHRLVYWPLPDAVPFDTAALARGVEGITREAVKLFGRPPYREYSFLLQDGAGGGLEHLNSVTLGTPSEFLARNVSGVFPEIGHEFMHTWNLMRIRPAEYRSVDYRPQPPTAGLWFSEGLSVFYSDLLLRRAGLPTFDSTRAARLGGLIARYLASPGHSHLSAERVSQAAYNAAPGSLGDYDAGTHLQGELIGTMLDLMVRDATRGTRSIDDVMRSMLERFSGEQGFLGRDIERTVSAVCGCDVTAFFSAHVRTGHPIDFNRFLALAGMRAAVSWIPALGNDGRPAPDLRIRAWQPPGESGISLLLSNPASAWGTAGLHTGDRLMSVNGAQIPSVAEFRGLLSRARLGDTLRIEVRRPAGRWNTVVILAGYDRPVVRIEELPGASVRQREIGAAWRAGKP